MLRSKKEKYIFIVLTLILLAAVVWRVSLHQMQKKSEPVCICVIAAKDSEVKYGEIMAGIRDYARENHLKVIITCPFARIYMARHKEYEDLL